MPAAGSGKKDQRRLSAMNKKKGDHCLCFQFTEEKGVAGKKGESGNVPVD